MVERIRINEPRTVVAGKVTVTTRSRPIEHVFDEPALGESVARAIRDAIAEGIRAISQVATPATLKFRAAARRAVARGAPWAEARYPGGREPAESDRLFNDSGELAGDLQLEQANGAWQVAAPADRGDPPGSSATSMFERLRALVPALANPLDHPKVQAAIAATWSTIVRKL